ncbi:endolytic transglycosylase MltG [Marinibacterium profundimaris]|uniref:Endolytic murein transglycosylase n=1 Tax=Marinibacterium profundimaris TaxID=1679460 RepID=A0A225NRP5_9RHOB|nr:endolytic transglycosylase MltG [Marinibacterium profundimaris]OWU77523.1 branched-chain alpha-keto acid dehydrogenase subunit E2 [Marinibacterium profundimaris]
MWRSLASNVLTLLIIALFLLGGLVLWGQGEYRAEGPLDGPMCLRVERGSNMTRVSETLLAEGAVTSEKLFRIGADYAGKSGQLKAGSFLLPEGASMEDIVDVVTRGGASTCGTEVVFRIGVTQITTQVTTYDTAENAFVVAAEFDPTEGTQPQEYSAARATADTRYRMVVAEGTTSWQVVEGLKAMDMLEGTIAEVPDEGTLAPDSYEVVNGAQRQALLDEMEAVQVLRVGAAWESRDPSVPVDSPEELLILASIIEKETGVPEERGQVASVFVNRLEEGMRLQTDPTVIYGITKGEGVLGRGLRQSELRGVTPWNTYVILGLPPTPIANPGMASLEAAANPDNTDYLFFVADGSGGHAFARTLEEHNSNVARWREIEAERANN